MTDERADATALDRLRERLVDIRLQLKRLFGIQPEEKQAAMDNLVRWLGECADEAAALAASREQQDGIAEVCRNCGCQEIDREN